MRKTQLLPILICLFATVAGGCGGSSDGPALLQINGQVTLDDQPLPEGNVLFQDPAGQIRSYSAAIKAGAYTTEIEAGKWKVLITASRAIPGKMVPDAAGIGMEQAVEQYIPAQYNERTTLEIDVQPSGEKTFTHALKSR